jgi:Dolichyl-phosphate-mannose-protein mannosyltransferase
MNPLAIPGLSDLAPKPAPAVPQVTPLTTSPGPDLSAALASTGYDITDLLQSGNNRILVRVRCNQSLPILLASGFLRTAKGSQLRFGSDSNWTAFSGSERDQKPARVVGVYWTAPWGPPLRVAAYSLTLPGQDIDVAAGCIVSLTAATVLALLGCAVSGWLATSPDCPPEGLWNADSILHLPILLGMLGCLLLSYDVRMPYDWCYRSDLILTLLGVFFFGKALLLFQRIWANFHAGGLRNLVRARTPPPLIWVLTLIALTLVGLAIRAWNMMTLPPGHDEVELALYSRGIFTLGFPHIIAGSYTRLLSTYELVTYPMALCAWIFGPSVPWYRLPSLIFGTLTIGLIGWVGYRLFDCRTGLTAAAIWTFLPIPVNWSGDGFYPSQEGFFALATFWLFYEAVREGPLSPRYLKLSTAAFILMYLSWEASGFIIFALFAALVILRWKQWDWISDGHLWRCFAVLTTIVVLQLCFRQLTLPPDYLGFIRDLSQLATPAVVPMDRLVFDPLYYIKTLFLAENHAPLTILALGGLLIAARRPALLYLDVSLATLYVTYSCLLDHYAPRYCFDWLSLLVLAATGSFFLLLDVVGEAAETVLSRAVKVACVAAGLVLLVLGTNEYVLKLFGAAPDPATPVYFDRLGMQFKADYGDADSYVVSHLKPGDVVVTRTPHVFMFITGKKADYSFDPRLQIRLLYDGGQNPPQYIDKWVGTKQIRSLTELQDIQARAHRVWLISDMQPDLRLLYTQDVTNYLLSNGKHVYESTGQDVIVLNGVGLMKRLAVDDNKIGLVETPAKVAVSCERTPEHVRSPDRLRQ